MTIYQIQEQVAVRKKVGRTQIYNYIKACKIKPLGARQAPQQYPDDAPQRILARLGLNIVTMPELRDERRRAAAASRGHGKKFSVKISAKKNGGSR